jgi:hypothetical protein
MLMLKAATSKPNWLYQRNLKAFGSWVSMARPTSPACHRREGPMVMLKAATSKPSWLYQRNLSGSWVRKHFTSMTQYSKFSIRNSLHVLSTSYVIYFWQASEW